MSVTEVRRDRIADVFAHTRAVLSSEDAGKSFRISFESNWKVVDDVLPYGFLHYFRALIVHDEITG